MRRPSGLSGQEDNSSRSQIAIRSVEARFVIGSEVICRAAANRRAELENAVAEICAAGVGIKVAIAGGKIDVVGAVCRQGSAALPDAARGAIWSRIPDPCPG